MPVRFETAETGAPEIFGALSQSGPGRPRLRVLLRPHKSLTPEGFVWFIGLTAGFISLPLLALVGTSLFFALFPFLAAAVAAIWWGLKRSWRDMDIFEELVLWDELLRLERHEPDGTVKDWEANPYWVRLELHRKGGPVPNYLTLRGGDRAVELGAFLTPAERAHLKHRLEQALRPA